MSGISPEAVFSGLEPAIVWNHFALLCAIPRASKQEAKLRQHLLAWAGQRGLAAAVDAAGNLIIRKPASPGRENFPGVILQAHLDMVCQNNADTPHDFSRDPIRPQRRDGWLVADGTTLGADNGIGVALILAVLEAADLEHGPIEALLTVDEEAGMGGARGLATDVLQGRLMLNLDTEAWGEFYLGCAGGLDVNVRRSGMPEALPGGWQGWRIDLRGLRGGHSGVDIHEERGNAIKLLVRVLRGLEQVFPLRLASLQGGTARNALPREATAIVALPEAEAGKLPASLAEWDVRLRGELAGVDAGIVLACSPAPGALPVLAPHEQGVWLASLHAAPHGVRRMSRQVPGIVETSNNLGMVDTRRVRRIVQFHGSLAARQRQRCTGGRDRQSFFAVRDGCREGGRLPGMGAQSRFAACWPCARRSIGREFAGDSTGEGDPRRAGMRHHWRQVSGAGHRLFRPDHPWRACAG